MTAYQDFFRQQLAVWPLARQNYESQRLARYRDLWFGDSCRIRLICLPARIGSSSAKITAKGEVDRPCFLCAHRLPPEQQALPLPGTKDFRLLVNPFPVFPQHYTIPSVAHRPQALLSDLELMFSLAGEMSDLVLFYNGGRCGASAPDHQHFQAGSKGLMPLQCDYPAWKAQGARPLRQTGACQVYVLENLLRTGWLIESHDATAACRQIRTLVQLFGEQVRDEAPESRINLLVWFEPADKRFVALLFPRLQHRPACFYAEGPQQRVTSPASVEMSGYYIFPRSSDYEQITPEELIQIYADVCLPEKDIEAISARLPMSLP